MTDLELFKAIVRATSSVSAEDSAIRAAVASVRALFHQVTTEDPVPGETSERKERLGRDRKERPGFNRSE